MNCAESIRGTESLSHVAPRLIDHFYKVSLIFLNFIKEHLDSP